MSLWKPRVDAQENLRSPSEKDMTIICSHGHQKASNHRLHIYKELLCATRLAKRELRWMIKTRKGGTALIV